MEDRRKSKRESSKTIDTKSNKIAKIIKYKSIALPITTIMIGILYTLYIFLTNYLEINSLKNNLQKIENNIQDLKVKEQKLKQENKLITKKLSMSDSYMLDTQKVSTILKKFINILILKHIIYDAKIINIENNDIYQNVVDTTLQVDYNQKYLNITIIKDIIKILLKDVLYIKDITIKNNLIQLQIYKKVSK
jgi:hypothetical protein